MTTQRNPSPRIGEIQALRALAALLVLIFHAGAIKGGYVGVDIFYVISGFLITGLLLKEMEKSSSFNFKAFYLRRIKRLLPTSFVVLALTAVVSWWLFPATMREELGKDIFAAAVYCSNFLFALWQMDYQNLNAIPPVVIHFWSLAVEEQFYLFWPFIIWLAFRNGQRRRVGQVIAVVTISSFLLSLYLTSTKPIWAFYSLPTRAWELGVGAILLFIPSRIRFAFWYPWLAVALLIYGSLFFTENTPFPGTAALAPVLGTAIAIASISSWPQILKTLSGSRPIQWLGEISYPLYLWHWPLLVIPLVYLGHPLRIAEKIVAIAATLFLADLTHRYIEEPLRHISIQPRRLVRLALIGTAITTSMGLVIGLSANNSINLGDGVTFQLADVMSKPKIYGDDCHVNNGETTSHQCTYGTIGSASRGTIVLFGDSHAAQWFPALEKLAFERKFTLISLTKSACPGPAVVKVNTGEYKNSDCSAWRTYAFKRIRAIAPMAVIVSGMQHFEMPSGYTSRAQWWKEGQKITFQALKGSSPHLIYISDTPHPERDIPNCVASGKLERCNGTSKTPAYFSSGWQKINPTAWLCKTSCPAIINGVVAYRDASHISVRASQSLAPHFDSALRALGVY